MFTSLDIFNIVGVIGIAIVFIAYLQAGKENERLHEENGIERERAECECLEDELATECTSASPAHRCGVPNSSPKGTSCRSAA